MVDMDLRMKIKHGLVALAHPVGRGQTLKPGE